MTWGRIFSWEDDILGRFGLGGFCPGGEFFPGKMMTYVGLVWGDFVLGDFHPGGLCPGDFHPGVLCPGDFHPGDFHLGGLCPGVYYSDTRADNCITVLA